MSSAERMRRLRARRTIAGELVFVRQDWSLFLDPTRLPQKAGCSAGELRALVLKELVDNGLDPGGAVTLEQVDADTWAVTDDGPGLDRHEIADLFSPARPLTSSKLLRRPTRGAVGNGLRVVSGAAVASGGRLWVESRGRCYEIVTDSATGMSRAEPCDAPCRLGTKVRTNPPACDDLRRIGTNVTIRFGRAIPRSDDDGRLARDALRFPGHACEPFRSHVGWYDEGSWHELVKATAPGTTAVDLLAAMGIASTDRRAAAKLAWKEASKLRLPPAPVLLSRGAGGLDGYAYAKVAEPGHLIECWAKVTARIPASRARIEPRVYVNRTPIVSRSMVTSAGWLWINDNPVAQPAKIELGAVYDIELSVTAAFVPIVNDGKSPDLDHFSYSIGRVLESAMREAYRAVAPVKPKKGDIKAAAWAVMAAAYTHAAGGLGVANARQVMYAARRLMEKLLGKDAEPVNDKYFAQTLLPDYIAAHQAECATWDVIYDDRGHLIEPHTGRSVPLGTMAVREYLRPRYLLYSGPSISVGGGGLVYGAEPKYRYKTALFIEKEGFEPLLQKARIRERFDCAILSTKGMSVVASRHLLDRLGRDGTVILVAHDFDRTGLGIAHTLANDGRRYKFEHRPEMIDIGLRLADVVAMDLQDEPAEDAGPGREKLEEYGATYDEIAFLVSAKRRIELNAMTSRQFLNWLESKFEKYGAGKVVPPLEMLKSKARAAIAVNILQGRIAEIEDAARREAAYAELPADLEDRVRDCLILSPELAWEQAVARVVSEAAGQ